MRSFKQQVAIGLALACAFLGALEAYGRISTWVRHLTATEALQRYQENTLYAMHSAAVEAIVDTYPFNPVDLNSKRKWDISVPVDIPAGADIKGVSMTMHGYGFLRLSKDGNVTISNCSIYPASDWIGVWGRPRKR